ncbi:GNAT family N-acetyltransferase [Rothia kristinae]
MPQTPPRTPPAPTVHRGNWLTLDPRLAYGLAQLRCEVFVMGQGITSAPELDGRDLEPETVAYWIADETGRPIATLRTLTGEPGSAEIAIGRVATAVAHRGRGLAGTLLRAVIEDHPQEVLTMHAQAHLRDWYARFGFLPVGPSFQEAGIEHLPLRREPGQA